MTITKLGIYDRVELVCPTPLLVSALRTRDISKAYVFYDIYIRKFNMSANSSLDELAKLLYNDSFCDPSQSSMFIYLLVFIFITIINITNINRVIAWSFSIITNHHYTQ